MNTYKKRRYFAIAINIGFFVYGSTCYAQIQKWVDENGKTHYGRSAPADAQLKKMDANISNMGAVGVNLSNDQVVLYSTRSCGYCKKAKAYLTRNNIPFTEQFIDSSRSAKLQYERLGGTGVVPLLVNGSNKLTGFRESSYDNFFAKY